MAYSFTELDTAVVHVIRLVSFRCPSVYGKRTCGIYIYTQTHRDTMECYSPIKRNTFQLVLERWMNLEPVIQSEVSKKEKSKFCILYIYMESRKTVQMKLHAGQE